MNEVVSLLPSGSANETVSGISHFFEHLIIAYLLERYKTQRAVVFGHTTEDYIILFGSHLNAVEIRTAIEEIDFPQSSIERCRRSLLREIQQHGTKPSETFFSALWEGTPYERSPLGTCDRIKSITSAELQDFREQLCRSSLYTYQSPDRVDCWPPIETGTCRLNDIPSLGFTVPKKKEKKIAGKLFELHFFNHHVEAYILLEYILRIINPDKQVQVSEKRGGSVLIVEKGVKWPSKGEWETLKPQALEIIHSELQTIEKDFKERALNQLESIFFYNKTWQQRTNLLTESKFDSII